MTAPCVEVIGLEGLEIRRRSFVLGVKKELLFFLVFVFVYVFILVLGRFDHRPDWLPARARANQSTEADMQAQLTAFLEGEAK